MQKTTIPKYFFYAGISRCIGDTLKEAINEPELISVVLDFLALNEKYFQRNRIHCFLPFNLQPHKNSGSYLQGDYYFELDGKLSMTDSTGSKAPEFDIDASEMRRCNGYRASTSAHRNQSSPDVSLSMEELPPVATFSHSVSITSPRDSPRRSNPSFRPLPLVLDSTSQRQSWPGASAGSASISPHGSGSLGQASFSPTAFGTPSSAPALGSDELLPVQRSPPPRPSRSSSSLASAARAPRSQRSPASRALTFESASHREAAPRSSKCFKRVRSGSRLCDLDSKRTQELEFTAQWALKAIRGEEPRWDVVIFEEYDGALHFYEFECETAKLDLLFPIPQAA